MSQRPYFTRRDIRKSLNHLIKLLDNRTRRVNGEFVLAELRLIRTQMAHGAITREVGTTRVVPKRRCIRLGCGHHQIKHHPFCQTKDCLCDLFMSPKMRTELLTIELQKGDDHDHDEEVE